MKSYKYEVVKCADNDYTIGHYDSGYGAYIINDGICGYYHWDSSEEAQAAADAYNDYDGPEWLGQHGYGNDTICFDEIESCDPKMVHLYRMFGAVESE